MYWCTSFAHGCQMGVMLACYLATICAYGWNWGGNAMYDHPGHKGELCPSHNDCQGTSQSLENVVWLMDRYSGLRCSWYIIDPLPVNDEMSRDEDHLSHCCCFIDILDGWTSWLKWMSHGTEWHGHLCLIGLCDHTPHSPLHAVEVHHLQTDTKAHLLHQMDCHGYCHQDGLCHPPHSYEPHMSKFYN